jgi:Eukaryotic aspartyl protease
MHYLQPSFCVALLLTSVLSAPTQPQKRSFKINRIRQTNYVPNGPKALRKAYVKFGFDDISFLPTVNITKVDGDGAVNIVGTDNGDVDASPTQNDAEFLSPVTVGGQTLVMDFDTGSSDMWVFNTNLPSNLQAGHTIYDPTKSSTFNILSASSTFNISYGDGSFSSGPVGLDTVDIGGATVAQQAIGLPDVVAASFAADKANNGLVGLAFSKLNTITPQQQKTFFDNVTPDLSQPLFTANLKHGTLGAYEFGTIDQTAFTGSLTTVPVDSTQGFWSFSSTSASINGQSVTLPSGSAIADTGTSLMLVDDSLVQAYYSQVSGAMNSGSAGGVIFPCDAALPDLQVAVGDSGAMATISGSLMNFSTAGSDQNTGTPCEFIVSILPYIPPIPNRSERMTSYFC